MQKYYSWKDDHELQPPMPEHTILANEAFSTFPYVSGYASVVTY